MFRGNVIIDNTMVMKHIASLMFSDVIWLCFAPEPATRIHVQVIYSESFLRDKRWATDWIREEEKPNSVCC